MKMFVECGRWDGKVTDTIALNLRLDELHAEFLLFELEHYDQRMDAQRQMARELKSVIPTSQPFLEECVGDRHVYSVFNLLLDRRDDFRAFMSDRGIDTMVYYNNDILPVQEREKYRAVTDRVCSVPCRWNLSDAEFRRIADALRSWFEENSDH
jgi:dTDP-4-amino-4,6-dideoxygalactose transaminase